MLAATRISVSFGTREVLSDVSLAVRPGELCVLLGCNGAGKSTLLAALNGDIPPSSGDGSITLDGLDLHRLTPIRLARRRAVLRQAASFSFAFRAEDAVRLGRYPYGDADPAGDRAIVAEAMTLTGTDTLARRDVLTLSGGELARVQLARALVQIWPARPTPATGDASRYLLLDEPTAALDIAQQHRMLALVQTLTRTWGIGVVAILHDLNLASRYADTIALLANGRIVAHGTPYDVLTPDHVQTCFQFPVRRIENAGPHLYVMPA
ncbi:heme ABC transporter ATP-binding protein [Burkholderia sp. WAC0059]|uniref:heme ABC transporter ATP-binding protein n=1 Tax=Burkholderia sp. WAC0059 TaxID=2066022 RepID=UPI000C7EB571|nr:heme ABC transporter ATP-binding protein [Burkholderia sp. WAC0059]PLZ03698.1 heme ABC transporter ATP-binding protein [Burkholderia sp. WAC0059]